MLRRTAIQLLPGAFLAHAQTRIGEAQYIESMNRGLEQLLARVPDPKTAAQMLGTRSSGLIFSANMVHAHGAFIGYFDQDSLLRYADGLLELGLQRIDINPGLRAWLENDTATTAKYDALIEHIRGAKVQIALNPEVNRNDLADASFAAWRSAHLRVCEELARRYRPALLSVLHEPTTMGARLGIQVSTFQAAGLADEAARIVKRTSPLTRVAAGALASESLFLKECIRLPSIDSIGLDVYDLRQILAYQDLIKTARQARKGVYIEETWRFPYQPPRASGNLETMSARSVGSRRFADVDAKWLEFMVRYARAWQLEAITPFWSQTFFHYTDADGDALDSKYNFAVRDAVRARSRTGTFERYRKLING